MSEATLKERFEQHGDQFVSVVSKILGQLAQREVELQHQLLNEKVTADAIEHVTFPCICISLVNGSETDVYTNVFLAPVDFLLQYQAWMLSDEIAEEIGEEHLDAARETLDQVLGNLRRQIPDDQGILMVKDSKVFLAESQQQVTQLLHQEHGLHCQYTLKSDDYETNIDHFLLTESTEEVNEPPNKEETEEDMMQDNDGINVEPVEFGDLPDNDALTENPRNVEMLLDVDLEVSVELDRKNIMVSELLKLGKGSIVELEKSAGEPLDIFVNGRKFAEGEVVVIDDRFGIRITQLLSPKDRLKSLG